MIRNLDFEWTTSIKTKRDNFETPLLDVSVKPIVPTSYKDYLLNGKS